MDDVKMINTIRQILSNGSNVEIKKKSDGTVAIYEVKKNKLVTSIGM